MSLSTVDVSFNLRMWEKIKQTVKGLDESYQEIEKTFNKGVIHGFGEEPDA